MLSMLQGVGSVRDFEDHIGLLSPPVPGSRFFAQPLWVAVKSRSPLKPFVLLFVAV